MIFINKFILLFSKDIKLIKSDSKNIYNAIKDCHFK